MRNIKIKVLNNKKMVCLNGSFTCKKGENKIDVLVFDVDENLLQYNNFIILKSPNGTTYVDIVLNDLKYSIGSFITNEIGNWTIQFLSSTQEDIVGEEEIDETQTIMLSDTLSFSVIDSLASGELVLPPTSANLDLLGEQLATLYNTFSVLAQDYPEIEDYIEVQTMLQEILYKMDNIKIDTSDLQVSVDMSETNAKIDDLSEQVGNIPTNDYTSDLGQIQSDTTTIKSRVNNLNTIVESSLVSNTNAIKSNTELTSEKVNTIDAKIGDNETKGDGTLFNYAYWNLERTMETKGIAQSNNTMLQTLCTQMSDANTLTDEILE